MDNLYALTLRTTLVAAGLLGLVAAATAISIGTPTIFVWVAISALAAYYAHHRLDQLAEEPAQTKSSAMSI